MTIDREKALNELLNKLRKADTKGNTDMDLVFEYLEKVINDPKIGGGSRKLREFQIDNGIDGTKTYRVSWIATYGES